MVLKNADTLKENGTPPNPTFRASRLTGLLATSFVIGLSGALIPGSMLALTVGTVAENGFWSGPLIVLGHAISELFMVVALAKGLGKLLQKKAVVGTIGVIGGLFLLLMAWDLSSTLGQPLALNGAENAAASLPITIISGFMVSITNPYWILWWASVGATYVAFSLQAGNARAVSVFYVGHEMSDIAWYTVVSFAVAGGAHRLSPAAYKVLLIVCSASVLILGAYFVVFGVRKMAGFK